MNIGCWCEGFLFCDKIGTRIKGPVDNFGGDGFNAVIDLFNGKLFDDLLNNKITKTQTHSEHFGCDMNERDEDFCDVHYYDKWLTAYTDFTKPASIEKLKERIDNFNNFIDNLSNDDFFVYTPTPKDGKLTKKEVDNIIKQIPSFVFDHLIVIAGTRNLIPRCFFKKFRIIQYNLNLNEYGNPNNIPNNLWHKIY